MVSEYRCTFEEFEAVVKQSEEETSAFITEYELVKVSDHKSILLLNCTDMDALGAFMSTPQMKQWDEDNGCVDIIYTMERIN
tara:strand:+ start:1761 stop:2006 length:246 start_codon:yes stop_codon:yes gene_type:complete